MPKDKRIIEAIDAPFDSVAKTMVKTGVSEMSTPMPSGKDGRIREADLYIPALRIANAYPGGFVSTADLILELEAIFNPTGVDNEILEGRADTRFSQKVRNLVSHRKGSQSNFINSGYAEYDDVKKGIQITLKGRRLLDEIQGQL